MCSSPPAPSPTSSISPAAAAPMWRSTFSCAAETWRRLFARADHVFEHTLQQPADAARCRSSRSFRSRSRATARMTIHTSVQMPSFVRLEIARLLGWPENSVRVKVPLLGGGFGAKVYIKLEALVAALALLVGRPVKISADHGRAVLHHHQAPGHVPDQERRAQDGRMLARKCEVFWNGGAYADIGPRDCQKSGFTSPGPYDIEQCADRFLRDLYQSCSGRGDARLRHSAAGLGLRKPYRHHRARARYRSVEFRRRNILREGRPQATGTLVRDAASRAGAGRPRASG